MKYLATIAVILLIINTGCMKTKDKYFSTTAECDKYEHLNNPEEYRDEYDECLIIAENELTDAEQCKKKCTSYCNDLAMIYLKSSPDFGGCRCKCQVTLE